MSGILRASSTPVSHTPPSGARSTTSVLCGSGSGLEGIVILAWCDLNILISRQERSQSTWRVKLTGKTSAAVTQTPSDGGEGIMTFFDPLITCNLTQPGAPATLNEAMLFHEALHGDYGYQDPELERHFGQTTDPGITYYINAARRGLCLRDRLCRSTNCRARLAVCYPRADRSQQSTLRHCRHWFLCLRCTVFATNQIAAFSIVSDTGALVPVPNSPFPTN
jgi:hypothetical protein